MRTRTATAILIAVAAVVSLQTAHVSAQGPVVSTTTLTNYKPRIDVFQTAAPSYPLTATPATGIAPMVYVNGLLTLPGYDYQMQGSTVAFTLLPTAQMASPTIQVLYWVAQ